MLVIEVQVRLLQAGQLRDPQPRARQELDDEPVPALEGVDEGIELSRGDQLGNHEGGESLELLKVSNYRKTLTVRKLRSNSRNGGELGDLLKGSISPWRVQEHG